MMKNQLPRLMLITAGLSLATSVVGAQTTPGETSGYPLAPLNVASHDPATGDMRLSYQTGCSTTNNNIYIGSLDQVSTMTWSDERCGIGIGGSHDGFNPGPGSYFFLIVGNDGVEEGSYGQASLGGAAVERAPYSGSSCALPQNLTNMCTPGGAGAGCGSSADCSPREMCLADGIVGPQCACLAPFTGPFCGECAPGYAGPDCRACVPGYVSNVMQIEDGGDLPLDPRAPEHFLCVPDVPGDCTGRTCSARGTCEVVGREAICACDEGYTGVDCQDCAPNYELDPFGGCSLGQACRDAKCGGNGECVATPFGDVTCTCDAGHSGVDCGGPALRITTSAGSLTLYDGDSVLLEPVGGAAPYEWEVVEGPARIEPCDPRDAACPPGGAELTIVAPPGGLLDLELIKVALSSQPDHQTAINLAAIPPSYLPITGALRTELVPFYQAMLKYMRARGIRGGVLGISKGGSIIGTNGYGYRDHGLDGDPFVNAGENGPHVQPNSPFRIASITKPLAAAAVRQAADDEGIDITSNTLPHQAARWVNQSIGFHLVNSIPPFSYNLPNPLQTDNRWGNISILHLLNHHVGFWRDSTQPALNGRPDYDSGKLPFTVDPNDPNDFQTALTGASSDDISYATMYALAALQQVGDPRPTVEDSILFAAGNVFDYAPGSNAWNGGSNYANIGYQLAGRVLEGLKGEAYSADYPGVPMGWGPFPSLLQDYLCEASGIDSGIHPGDAFNPQPGEPYYRHLQTDGSQQMEWNLAEGSDKIRWDDNLQMWLFCQEDCPDGPNASWNTSTNTPEPYGGIWLAQRNSAGGIVATTSALLKFARNHRVKVGSPNDGETGTGSLLVAPGAYGAGSSHDGSLPGTRSWLWQMGGSRTNNVPLPWGAWNPDPSAPLDLDQDGNVIINEITMAASSCTLPSDVAVAVMFNQRRDQRAPTSNAVGNSDNSDVYRRIIDLLGDAACQVDAEGWPVLAEPPAQFQAVPVCN